MTKNTFISAQRLKSPNCLTKQNKDEGLLTPILGIASQNSQKWRKYTIFKGLEDLSKVESYCNDQRKEGSGAAVLETSKSSRETSILPLRLGLVILQSDSVILA